MSTITLEALSRTGLRLLANHGLADVSMRRVAKEFDVAVSALYWHVKDKQSLLGAMVDQLFAGVAFPSPTGDQRADLAVRAELLYDAMLTTRDAAELTASVLALGTGGQRIRNVIDEVSPDPVTTDAVLSLLIGHATLNQQRMQAENLGIAVTGTTTSTFRQTLDLLL